MRSLLPLLLLPLIAASACDERENTEFHFTRDAEDTHVEDVAVEDTDSPDSTQTDTPPEDIDEGPKELVHGATATFGHVVDGDTLDVFIGDINPARYTARLKGLSAPECLKDRVDGRFQCVADDEFFGLQSRQGLVDLVEGATGTITCDTEQGQDEAQPGTWCPKDNYDRYLVYIEIEGQDVATSLASQGLGLSYTSFWASKRAQIRQAEYDAQDARRGMWAEGSVDAVIGMMSDQTQGWYDDHHDWRCAEALGQ